MQKFFKIIKKFSDNNFLIQSKSIYSNKVSSLGCFLETKNT